MGAIHIQTALKQMDGVFGCKVLAERNEANDIEYKFAKKTIVDLFCGLFASADEKSEQSSVVVRALLEIQNQVGTENDKKEIEALATKYANNRNLINFKEIRKTLRDFLNIEFPPAIFTRSAGQGIQAAEIKPDNLNAQQATVAGARLNVSAPIYRVEQNAEDYQLSSTAKNTESVQENSAFDDMVEIEAFLSYDNPASVARKNRTLVTGEEKAGASNKPSIEKASELTSNEWTSGKEYWLSFYDNKLKDGTFVQVGTTKIERDDKCKITNENLEAFCEILIWVNKNEKMPIAIVGGIAKINALVYEKLCKYDQDFAEKVKLILLDSL